MRAIQSLFSGWPVDRGSMPSSRTWRVAEKAAPLRSFFDAGVKGQGLHDLFDLLLNQLQLLTGAFAVEHTVPHGDGDAIHVLDLGDDLFGRPAKSDVATLVGESPVAAPLEVLRRELPSHFNRLSYGTAGDGA